MTKDEPPLWIPALGKVLTAFDAQVRQASVKAHMAVVKEMCRIEGHKFGDYEIPADALLPRELPHPRKIALETKHIPAEQWGILYPEHVRWRDAGKANHGVGRTGRTGSDRARTDQG